MTASLPRGFAALISTLVICAVITGLAFQSSASAYLARRAVLEAEYKEASRALAYSCREAALYALAADITYRPGPDGDRVWFTPERTCTIVSMEERVGEIDVVVHAREADAHTWIRFTIDSDTTDGPIPFVLTISREI